MSAAGARARVRAELTREIADVARRHLATEGAAALSLRAVAREMGMASSAVYRYYPSRDDLLTALIVQAYDMVGAAAEAADTAQEPTDLLGRWQGVCRAVRQWALVHPHEYTLIYGSPVPGYTAPALTIGPAARVAVVLCRIMATGLASATTEVTADGSGADASLTPGVAIDIGLPDQPSGSFGARAVQTWTGLFGLISFELFGQMHNVVDDHDAFFAAATMRLAEQVGLTS